MLPACECCHKPVKHWDGHDLALNIMGGDHHDDDLKLEDVTWSQTSSPMRIPPDAALVEDKWSVQDERGPQFREAIEPESLVSSRAPSYQLLTPDSFTSQARHFGGIVNLKEISSTSPMDLVESLRTQRETFVRDLHRTLDECPEVIRGVHLRSLLGRCGANLHSSTSTRTKALYPSSLRVEMIDVFVSHSWHASGALKFLAVSGYHNSVAATVIGSLSFCLFLSLWLVGMLPTWKKSIDYNFVDSLLLGCTPPVNAAAWGGLGFSGAYVVVVLFWQQLKYGLLCLFGMQRYESVFFFDKACIHQDDPMLKRKGINAIGGFLLRSRKLLIVWEQTHFERMWCVFEMAVWLTLGRPQDIIFLPISLYAFEFFLTITIALSCVVWIGLLALELPQWFVRVLTAWGLAGRLIPFFLFFLLAWVALPCVVYSVRKYIRARDNILLQLQKFTVANAKCTDENDRTYITDIICNMYGGVDSFDMDLRDNIRMTLSAQLGEAMTIPYWLLFRSFSVPLFLIFGVEFTLAFPTNTKEYNLRFLRGVAALSFLQSPFALHVALERIPRLHLATSTKFGEAFTVAVLSCVASLWIALLAAQFHWTASAIWYVEVIEFAGFSLLDCIVWRRGLVVWCKHVLSLLRPSRRSDGSRCERSDRCERTDESPDFMGI